MRWCMHRWFECCWTAQPLAAGEPLAQVPAPSSPAPPACPALSPLLPLAGPNTLVGLACGEFDRSTLVARLVPAYAQLLSALGALGVPEVQASRQRSARAPPWGRGGERARGDREGRRAGLLGGGVRSAHGSPHTADMHSRVHLPSVPARLPSALCTPHRPCTPCTLAHNVWPTGRRPDLLGSKMVRIHPHCRSELLPVCLLVPCRMFTGRQRSRATGRCSSAASRRAAQSRLGATAERDRYRMPMQQTGQGGWARG